MRSRHRIVLYDEPDRALREHLEERGASFLRDDGEEFVVEEATWSAVRAILVEKDVECIRVSNTEFDDRDDGSDPFGRDCK